MRWQRKARIVVALAGIGCAGAVFFAIGERENRAAPAIPTRVDPRAIMETAGAVVQQIRGVKEDYKIKAQQQLTYEGGSSKSIDVEITVVGRGGRDFVMTGKEAQAGEKNASIDITGNVKLRASDGFEVHTEQASFADADGVVRAPGALTFNRGGMSGSGVGMTYDKNNDVLTITENAQVTMKDADGNTSAEFTGGTATLSRRDHVLTIERSVRALRGEQDIESDKATARLTEDDEEITYIELRGNSRVAGGSTAFDSMSANDIDLDYTDDGAALERVLLKGNGAIALTGDQGAAGRQFFGDTLTVALATDGSVAAVTGHENVKVDLPATATSTARSIRARTVEATGEPGKGLTAAQFNENVQYQESAAKAGALPRAVKSRTLKVGLTADAISSASFAGGVVFADQGLTAGAANAEYDPNAGLLRLQGADQGGGPRVTDQDVAVTASAIDVTLEGHRMTAIGGVKTTLQPQKGASASRMPGLLEDGQAVNVNGNRMEYDGGAGQAVYDGNAQLFQGETSIYANHIAIDRATGDLTATGAARSTMVMDKSVSIGRAESIVYTDVRREIEYRGTLAPPPPAAARAPNARRAAPVPVVPGVPGAAAPVQLSGPEGDLKSDRIVVVLQKGESALDRLEAFGPSTLRLDTRLATGSRLTYYASEGRYVMSGVSGVPVKVIERCNVTSGKTLTFFKTADRIIVDGNEEIRTQTTSGGGPCPETRSP